jgi:N-acetylmuramoyl-L-alanine amidase
MKRLSLIALIGIFLFSFFPVTVNATPDTDHEEIAVVYNPNGTDSINLLKEPNENSRVITSIPSLSNVTVLKTSEDYTYIRYTDSENQWIGYVKTTYIKDYSTNSVEVNAKAADTDQNKLSNENQDDKSVRLKNKPINVKIKSEKTSDSQVNAQSHRESETPVGQPKNNTVKVKKATQVHKDTKKYYGIAIKEPTNVYSSASTNSNILKSYSQGTKLIYRTFKSGWYECTVYIHGQAVTGYINANDVEVPDPTPKSIQGIGLKNKTKVYEKANTQSKVLKSYAQGSVLKYRTYVSGWYQCTVYVNGKALTGYINANDVEVPDPSPKSIQGIGLKNKTKVYEKANPNSKVLKSYAQGSVLKYRTYVSGWYECTVYVNGKALTGYINANDVEVPDPSPKSIQGIGLKNKTKVYEKANPNSKVLKSYAQGSVLKYRTYVSGWYECTVYVNGKALTGYINADDVEVPDPSPKSIQGIGLKNKTKVYEKANTQSKVLKSYAQGSILRYRTYVTRWYECTVYVNGKAKTGYISAKDVENAMDHQKSIKGIAYDNPTKVYAKASTSSKVLKTYKKGSTLIYRPFTSEWFICTVYINGKPKTGFIKKPVKPLSGRVIIIDPGHGGIDPGAKGIDGIPEKTINLSYALAVKDALERNGAKAILTRTKDENCKDGAKGHAELQCRVDFSKKYKADVFISIHSNWWYNHSTNGVETHFNDFNDPEYPGVNDYPKESKRLAKIVQKHIVKALGEKDKGVIDDNLYVTRENTVPAILIELGYISNTSDLKNLKSNKTKKNFSQALSDALIEFFKS